MVFFLTFSSLWLLLFHLPRMTPPRVRSGEDHDEGDDDGGGD